MRHLRNFIAKAVRRRGECTPCRAHFALSFFFHPLVFFPPQCLRAHPARCREGDELCGSPLHQKETNSKGKTKNALFLLPVFGIREKLC